MTKEKINLPLHYKIIIVWALVLFVGILATNLRADEIKFNFKSPSFSGIGTSAHYLTIEQQEFSRKEQLKADLKALEEQRKRDEENSVISRFTHLCTNQQTDRRTAFWREPGDDRIFYFV